MDGKAELKAWLEAAQACRPTCQNVEAFDELIAARQRRAEEPASARSAPAAPGSEPLDAREAGMKGSDHTLPLGSIVTNLQALETHIRYFLLRASGQQPSFPKKGDKDAAENYLTLFISLGELVKKYNSALSSDEAKFRVDEWVVAVRNALAHGRLVTETEIPATLWKFGPSKDGRVPVEFCETLTKEWMVKTSNFIAREIQKVLSCFAGRRYEGLRRG